MLLNFIPLQAADLNRISLASWDWIVIAIFFLAMVWICYDVSRKKKETSGDYFLSGRSATWIAIGASIFASNIGSEHLIGLAGTGASAGMAQAHWEIQGWMILILGWVFVPFYERSMVYTMPEFLEKRYNKESRGILTWLSLASYVLTKVSVTVLAGGLALNTLLLPSTPSSAVWSPSSRPRSSRPLSCCSARWSSFGSASRSSADGTP